MKIVGFTQLRNELSKGNLHNWLKQMFEICEYVYVYDQNSDDGSKEIYKNFSNLRVIESEINDFKNEISCKKKLLDTLLLEQPDTEFIIWLDGDSLLDSRLTNDNNKILIDICNYAKNNNIDGILLGHYNLWRSDIHYRIDNAYHSLSHGVCAIWRNNKNLNFQSIHGLHQPQYPNGIVTTIKIPYSIIHRGFATDYQIITKYNVYKSYGQDGWALERLLDETTLEVVELDTNILPSWFKITDATNPKEKEKIINIFKKQNEEIN
jgi:hypothetical protein